MKLIKLKLTLVSLNLFHSIFFFFRDINVRSEIYKCCAYNGVIYGASVFTFYYIILNILKLALDLTLTQATAQDIWDIVQPTLTLLFDILWTVPLFLIFKVINVFWFQVSVIFFTIFIYRKFCLVFNFIFFYNYFVLARY